MIWSDDVSASGPRVVSINTCTDQLVLALADPGQIAGLSRFAVNREVSYLAQVATGFPVLRGTAEEIFRTKPDVVLASPFSGRATREILLRLGVRVEAFTPPVTIDEAKAEIARAAEVLGQRERGRALISSVDAAAGRAIVAASSSSRLGAVAIHRRGFVAGSRTLLSDVLRVNGLDNVAARMGIDSIGQVSLEGIISLSPDIVVLEGSPAATDQGAALLEHTALRRRWPERRRIVVPIEEISCSGPALPVLIERVMHGIAAARTP